MNVSNHGRKIVLEALEDGRIEQEMLELYDEISVQWRKSVAASRKLSKTKQLSTTVILNKLLDAYNLPMLSTPRPELKLIKGGRA